MSRQEIAVLAQLRVFYHDSISRYTTVAVIIVFLFNSIVLLQITIVFSGISLASSEAWWVLIAFSVIVDEHGWFRALLIVGGSAVIPSQLFTTGHRAPTIAVVFSVAVKIILSMLVGIMIPRGRQALFTFALAHHHMLCLDFVAVSALLLSEAKHFVGLYYGWS